MLIGIISDTHDNIWALKEVFQKLKEKKVQTVIHCGDFCAPFVIKMLTEQETEFHCVYGNTDDRATSKKIADSSENVKLHGEKAEIELGGKNIAVTHYPDIAEELAKTGKYDIVFFGHTHQKEEKQIENCKLVNPGEIMGLKGIKSFAIYNTETDKVEFFEF